MMPKGFTDKEKEIIKQNLLEKGIEFISKYGIKKTNIEEITQSIGISKGAFYLFFDSKEEYIMDVIEFVEAKAKEDILHLFETSQQPFKERFKMIFHHLFKDIAQNNFYKFLLDKNEMQVLLRKLPENRMQKHIEKDNLFAEILMERFSKIDTKDSQPPEVISGILRALFLLSMYKEEIGQASFNVVIEFYIDAIFDKLFS